MKTKKRLFIGLLSASLILIFGLIVLIWFLMAYRDTPLYRVLLLVFSGCFLVVLSLITFGIAGMVLTIYKAKAIPSLQSYVRMAINLLFPVALGIGRLLNIDKNLIRSSFIEVNNQMVYAKEPSCKSGQIMILAPHCLQKTSCPHKITMDINNCKMCGGCSVYGLRRLVAEYGAVLVIATGGTLARKFIEKYRPKAIVAIACEQDLTSGILDVNPLPVLGVLNQRPEGPCYNTGVDLGQVEKAIKFFLVKEHSWEKSRIYKEVEG